MDLKNGQMVEFLSHEHLKNLFIAILISLSPQNDLDFKLYRSAKERMQKMNVVTGNSFRQTNR
jgi:hypothetical protein